MEKRCPVCGADIREGQTKCVVCRFNLEKYQGETKQENKAEVKCPACGSNKVKRITTSSRLFSIAMVGLASSKIGKSMKCLNCGYKF